METQKTNKEYKWKISRTAWLDDAFVYAETEEIAHKVAVEDLGIEEETIFSIHKIIC